MSNSSTAIQTLRRRFRLGATVLDDIEPSWSPERVLAAYIPNYPYLQGATLSEPVIENNEFLTFTVQKPIAQTKGQCDLDRALKEIQAWGERPVADPKAVSHWTPVLQKIQHRLREGTIMRSPHIDPFLIPLA